MDQKGIDRINELARKAKTVGLHRRKKRNRENCAVSLLQVSA